MKLIKKEIKPLNKNVVKNYFSTSNEDLYKQSYAESTWGILLPDYSNENWGGHYESLFTANLFSDLSLPVMFHVSRLGVAVEKTKLNIHEKSKFHSEDKTFTNKKFVEFYKLCFQGSRMTTGDIK